MSNYKATRDEYAGSQITETSITRVGGATDGVQAQSMKLVTNAQATFLTPYRELPLAIWNDVTGADVSVTVYGTVNSASLPLNDEIWLECQYLGNASNSLASFKSTSKSHPLAIGAAVASDSSTWGVPALAKFDTPTLVDVALSNNDLTVTRTANVASNAGARSLDYKSSGKYYLEFTLGAVSSGSRAVGILDTTGTYGSVSAGTNCVAYNANTGAYYSNNASTGLGPGTATVGDVLCFAIDLDARLAWMRKNGGIWNNNAANNPATGVGGVAIGSGSFVPVIYFSGTFNASSTTLNAGHTTFAQTAPSGFGSWASSWLPFKLTATLTSPQPQQRGYIYARILAGKASTTYYIDPKLHLSSTGGVINGPMSNKVTRDEYAGSQITDTSITRSGGAVAGTSTTPISTKIATNAQATFLTPYRALRLAAWNGVTGADRTVTVCGTINAASLPLNDEIWLECQYLGNASSPLASFKSSAKSHPLAVAANVSSDGSTWNGGGSGAGWSPFKLVATLTAPQPQQKGFIYASIRAAKPSTTFYIDPLVTLGVAAPWTPVSLTGLIGWWDASVTASLTLVGSRVDAVANQVAGGISLLPTTGSTANQPTYNATGFNSRPAMMFAGGSSQRLGAFSLPLGTGSELTFFFVGYMTTSTSTNYGRAISYTIPGGEDYNSNLSFCFTRDDSLSAATFFRNSVSTSVAFGYATNHRVICTVKADGTKTIYIDGVATTVSLTGAAFGTGGTFAVGNGTSVSAASTGWDGPIAEVGVCNAWHDATAVAALDTYLKNKWGL